MVKPNFERGMPTAQAWLIMLLASVFAWLYPALALAQTTPRLSLAISCDKKSYIVGEPIIVTSALTNQGSDSVSVEVPKTLAFVVTYKLETKIGAGSLLPRFSGPGMPAHTADIVELKPNQTETSSSELFYGFRNINELPPGDYVLRAFYHLSKYAAADYATNLLESNRVELTFTEPSEREKAARLQLVEIEKIESPNSDFKKKRRIALDFLSRYPDSIYRVAVLDELLWAEEVEENWMGVAGAYRQLRREKISTSKRERVIGREAAALLDLGDVRGAVAALKDATDPVSVKRRSDLEAVVKALDAGDVQGAINLLGSSSSSPIVSLKARLQKRLRLEGQVSR